jgi:predicted enzyme related to lactoylglutathione lyase
VTAPIVHVDMTGPDEARLHAFYAGAFGWGVDVQGPGYALVTTPDGGPNGAIVEHEEASLTLGIEVADLDAAVADVERLGGQVLMPPTDNGWVRKALVTDPAGNRLSLIASD